MELHLELKTIYQGLVRCLDAFLVDILKAEDRDIQKNNDDVDDNKVGSSVATISCYLVLWTRV
jgi:hypothetical protein